MEYKRFDNKIILRLDPGEEIIEKITELAETENIDLASFNGLGAIDNFEIGLFDTKEKVYHSNNYEGPHEISSLHGTITKQDNKPYLHVHLTAADINNNVVGGHLNKARISATGEIIIDVINGYVDRKFNNEIGLNLFEF